MLTSRLFGSTTGACPVCGAANQSCTGPDSREPSRLFLADGYKPEFPWRSVERVYGTDEHGHRVLRYAVGTMIPLIEALRQGVVDSESLTKEQFDEVLAHAARDPEAKKQLVEALKMRKPKKDKQVKDTQLVTK